MKRKIKDSVDLNLFDKLMLDDIINDSTAYVYESRSDQSQEDESELPTDETDFSEWYQVMDC